MRTVHIPPPFLAMLQKHLLGHAAAGPTGLLFPGDRTDHMSVRYLMDHYRPAREAAGRPELAIHQRAPLDRDRSLAERIGATYEAWRESRP